MNSTVGEAMPQEALVVAIPVLVVSIISLAASIMLFLMQYYHSERWSCTLRSTSPSGYFSQGSSY
jgi:hypothetical protein